MSQISDFIKIRPVGAELFHADKTDGRTRMKLIVAFRNFANALINHTNIHAYILMVLCFVLCCLCLMMTLRRGRNM